MTNKSVINRLWIECSFHRILELFGGEFECSQFSLAPRLIRDDSWARVWFMQDNDFKLPKCSTKMAIHAPIMASDPMNTFLSAMYIVCLQVWFPFSSLYIEVLVSCDTFIETNKNGSRYSLFGMLPGWFLFQSCLETVPEARPELHKPLRIVSADPWREA